MPRAFELQEGSRAVRKKEVCMLQNWKSHVWLCSSKVEHHLSSTTSFLSTFKYCVLLRYILLLLSCFLLATALMGAFHDVLLACLVQLCFLWVCMVEESLEVLLLLSIPPAITLMCIV